MQVHILGGSVHNIRPKFKKTRLAAAPTTTQTNQRSQSARGSAECVTLLQSVRMVHITEEDAMLVADSRDTQYCPKLRMGIVR